MASQCRGDRGEHGHAHRDAVVHLLADDRARAVGDLGGDLDAAVHRARMHDEHAGRGQLQPLRRQAEIPKYAASSSEAACAMRSFWMRSIITTSAPAMPSSMRVKRCAPRNSSSAGSSASGATRRRSVVPRVCSARRRRARDARMLDVADDGDLEAGEAALVRANRQHVEQSLRGMREVRLAGADHRHVRRHVIDQELGHARLRNRESRTRRCSSPRACRWCPAWSRPWRASSIACRGSARVRPGAGWPDRTRRACACSVRRTDSPA